jgi:hypothetical protein
MSRPHYFGTDDVIYCENAAGRVYLTTNESPIPSGYVRNTARTATEKETVWAKISAQEKRHAEQMTETLYNQRMGRIGEIRSKLNQRKLSVDCTQIERDFIRASLEILDRKEEALNKHSAYGVAAMQEKEAPISSAQKVTIPDA